ncbi:MAG: protein translocase SEC61 complex subunit gamma [Methermicoccaceae archaeon]
MAGNKNGDMGPVGRLSKVMQDKKRAAEKTSIPDVSAESIRIKLREYVRTLRYARKPTKEEFLVVSKVAAAGILLVGLIGFFVYLLMNIVPSYF